MISAMRVTKQTWATVIAVALSSAAQVDSVHAQQVTMPETVQAQADGTFSFTAEFTAGAEEVLVLLGVVRATSAVPRNATGWRKRLGLWRLLHGRGLRL